MIDLWGWCGEREAQYEVEGDQRRLQMARIRHDAFALSESDPRGMVELEKKGRDLAKMLGEPWWVFLYDVWIAIAYNAHVHDPQSALHQSLHCVNEARKPILKGHPWRIAASNMLLSCYVNIDPIGYSAAIRSCLRHLKKEIPQGGNEHRYVMMNHECDFWAAKGNLRQVEKIARAHQSLFDQDPWADDWYLVQSVLTMCWVGCCQQDWEKVLGHAQWAEALSRSLAQSEMEVAEGQLWQAVAARKTGDEKQAKRLCRAAEERAARMKKDPSGDYYKALVFFHELGENLDEALAVRDRQLARIAGQGRFGYECDVLIKRCDLLARLGRLHDDDIGLAMAATARLKNPKPYRTRLRRLKRSKRRSVP